MTTKLKVSQVSERRFEKVSKAFFKDLKLPFRAVLAATATKKHFQPFCTNLREKSFVVSSKKIQLTDD